jgi:hypothetical protein
MLPVQRVVQREHIGPEMSMQHRSNLRGGRNVRLAFQQHDLRSALPRWRRGHVPGLATDVKRVVAPAPPAPPACFGEFASLYTNMCKSAPSEDRGSIPSESLTSPAQVAA